LLTRGLALTAVAAALAFAGCSGEDSALPPETAPPETTAAETGGAETIPPPAAPAAEPECEPDEILPFLQEQLTGVEPELSIVAAEVVRCRQGHAQVFAVPDETPCQPGGEYCYEKEQLFLSWSGQNWRIVAGGTDLACAAGTNLELSPVCSALGYPDLNLRAFKLPAGNIGCRFLGGNLRCDILSGLVPAPDGDCELDWTGVALERTGQGDPVCAGDTVYDEGAATLEYGWTWRRAGLECVSRETGLTCTNRDGRGFTVAREAWTAF
jgi:hypothetical protein